MFTLTISLMVSNQRPVKVIVDEEMELGGPYLTTILRLLGCEVIDML